MATSQQHPFTLTNESDNCFNLTHGFLPEQDPIASLPDAWQAAEALTYDLPKLLASQYTKPLVNRLPPLALTTLNSPAEVERAMMVLSFLAHAYVWEDPKQIPHELPAAIAVPWQQLAKQLGRPPVLSYASYALYNWRRIIPNKPIELGNIALLQNFWGGIDEEWFILIHVDIEARAIPALQSLLPLQQAIIDNDPTTVQQQLEQISNSLAKMIATLNRMPEFCDPYIYYQRVRPFIHGWKNNPSLPNGLVYQGVTDYQQQPQFFKGETGAQSTIIPALDAVLGITHENTPLKSHLEEMRDYMPPQHRQLLEELEQGKHAYDFILTNYPQEPTLIAVFNRCVKLITEFRSIHLRYAAEYIHKQHQTSAANSTTVGTGGTPFMAYLKKHEKESEKFLL